MIPRARPRVDAMKRGRRENENGGRGDGGYTQGGNVLINGRAPPLPRGRINIFGCSNACKKAVERERERGGYTRMEEEQNMLRHELPQEHRRISFIITWGPSIYA